MNKPILLTLSSVFCLYFSACKAHNSDDLSHHNHNHNHSHEHTEHNDAESHDEIMLNPEMAERFGVATEKVAIAPFHDALKVSGEILPSPTDAAILVAPTSGIIKFRSCILLGSKVNAGSIIASISSNNISGGDKNLAARATYEAAKRELDRIKPLYDEKLVTATDYNNALKAYEEAKAGYSATASTGSITSPITGAITSIDVAEGQYVETGTPIATVSSSAHLTVRADVPQKYLSQINSFSDAAISLPYSDSAITLSSIGGKRNNSLNTVTATPGYIPVYFSFNNNGEFIAGTSIDVYLRSDNAADLISVPLSALSEQQGQFYVFVRLDDECYRKCLVKTGRNNGERIEIKSGLAPGDNVVVSGTTTVRIAESSGAVPEGHSHNH